LIGQGIPPVKYLPASDGMLVRGKRHLLAAPGKTGKSIAMLAHSVDMVLAGATVVILDRENGKDEYARRLRDIIEARELGDKAVAQIRERLVYVEFPRFQAGDGEKAAEQIYDWSADLVLFGAQRMFLSDLGLDEDNSDDYAGFIIELIEPLSQAGIATLILDNTGHADANRSRGTSAKGDLNEVLFTVEVVAPFAREKPGALTLKLEPGQSRFGNTGEWSMKLGGGDFGSWEPLGVVPAVADADDVARDLVLDHVRDNPGTSWHRVRASCRGQGAGTKRLEAAKVQLISEGDLRMVKGKLYVG
jgi:AAA domain